MSHMGTPALTPEQERAAQIKADAQDLEGAWEDGKRSGRAEGREDTRAALTPYVRHIGNCGAAGGDPEDSRCICGLRQIWHGGAPC